MDTELQQLQLPEKHWRLVAHIISYNY